MKGIGIKYQLRITILIPVLLVAILFGVFYNGQFAKDLKQHMAHLGETYIRQLLPAAQLAILRHDRRTLQGLIDESIINPEVHALSFYNAQGELLASRGGKHPLKLKHFQYTKDVIESKQINPYIIHFIAPITLPNFNIYSPLEGNQASHSANNVLGWLSIDIDTKLMLIKRYQMYIVTIFITLFGLLLSLITHYFLSKKIYKPINRLRRSMKQILRNEFETQITVSSRGELGLIEQGCAHLQKAYLAITKELNQHIETATTDIQHSLELLEEKNVELTLDKKKAEDKSRQKSEFIANMSHEVRTPMSGIIGFTNVLLESKLDPLQLDYVKTIKSSAQDLLNILNDILDYSKIDAGKLHLDCIPLNIRSCIDEILALTAPLAHKKGIDLIPSTATEVPRAVLGDPLRLKQIISNLVNNAIKFTEQGYVLIRTTIEQETDKDYTICLSVIDTGIGISLEDQSTLFHAFKQVDTTITRRYGGSGLGLIICKKLAEYMQGHVSIVSDVNKGSTFSVHLKFAKLPTYEIEKHQAHRFGHLKIICFDDNPLHLEALCNGLGYWGIHCIRVSSFQQLENTFGEHLDAHAAFISVNQGCELQVGDLLKQISTPVVLMSKWYIEDYQSLGAKDFIFKPPNIQKLRATLDGILNQSTSNSTHIDNQEIETLRKELRALKPQLLIAEDNPVNQMLLKSILSDNATVHFVSDGSEAVDISQHKRFQVILLDLQMPRLNGLEAAHLIRAKSLLNKTTPMILISANSGDICPINVQKTGITLCLQKPIDEIQLLHHLLTAIQQSATSAINWHVCVQKASGKEKLALQFLAKFIEELKINRIEFLELFNKQDIQGLERCAHKLHGACCFFGVALLQQHVAQLENQAIQAIHIDELNPIFEKLIQSIDAVIDEYEQTYQHLNTNHS